MWLFSLDSVGWSFTTCGRDCREDRRRGILAWRFTGGQREGNDLMNGSTEYGHYSEALGVSRSAKAGKTGRYNNNASFFAFPYTELLFPVQIHVQRLPSILSFLHPSARLIMRPIGTPNGPIFLPLRSLRFNHSPHTRYNAQTYPAENTSTSPWQHQHMLLRRDLESPTGARKEKQVGQSGTQVYSSSDVPITKSFDLAVACGTQQD